MPTEQFLTTLTANQTIGNIFAGSQFEFPDRPTRVQVYQLVELGNLVSAQMFFGQQLQMPLSPVNVSAVAGQGPIVPDDLILDDVAMPTERITIGVTETAGAAGIIRTKVVLTAVA